MTHQASRRSALAVLFVTGCSVSGDPGPAPAAVSVDLVYSQLGVKVARVYPVEQFPPTHFQSAAAVRYQLLDAGGAPVVAGVLPDTRWAYAEGHDQSGVPLRQDVRFEQGYLTVRLPAVAGTLVLIEPREEGAIELGRVTFDPAARPPARAGTGSSAHALAEEDDVLGAPVTIHGTDDARIRLLILPEGYTEAEMPLFEERAAEMVQELFASVDYSDYEDAFRVQRQNVRSRQSGLEGLAGDSIDSAFELQASDFCPEFGGPRSWWGLGGSKGEDKARALGDEAGANITIVLINHEEGLTACVRNRLTVLAANDESGRVLGHELGHGLFDLGDEYVVSHETPAPVCTVLGWFGAREKANVTTDGDSPPWFDLVSDGVPLPTPPDFKYAEKVGAFEGAQGCATGYYRPAYMCLMDNISGAPFCPVCRREMDRFFGALGYQAPADDPACPKEWRDDGICDRCLGDDPDCGGLRCNQDGVCDTPAGEGCVTCPEDCSACVERGCGDGQCADDETDTCEQDCGCRADYCQAEVAPFGCWCDASCEGRGDCCWDAGVCNPD